MAGSQKVAQERLFRFRKPSHVHRTLAATQHCTQRDHQQLMEVMQPGVPGSWVFQTLPAAGKLIQGVLPPQVSRALR